jgi:preprotein translocase subunit Sec63
MNHTRQAINFLASMEETLNEQLLMHSAQDCEDCVFSLDDEHSGNTVIRLINTDAAIVIDFRSNGDVDIYASEGNHFITLSRPSTRLLTDIVKRYLLCLYQ